MGAVIVPCNPMLRERELTKILADSGSRILISQRIYADVAAPRRSSGAARNHHVTIRSARPLDTNPARPVGDAASSRRSRRPLRAGKRTRRTGAPAG